jgi:hypothetical protein
MYKKKICLAFMLYDDYNTNNYFRSSMVIDS